ncbi:MAG TPA: ATP-binding cassette domain-containing protein [Nitrososphaerales archaeon]|nr:ATP-binding cassette domain-containing protein [Nitrososphaerales archaeon]
MQSDGYIIKVDGLSKSFNGKLKAVDSLSFDVREREIFGFLGPNGAGKTTTIKMLTTLLKPTSGSAEVCGYDINSNANDVRAAIGIVPQEYTADEDLTGYQNIRFCADLYGIPRTVSKDRTKELLDLVGLQESAGRKVQTYSGGMRRRLEIACGLINHPRLLFLDEPTLGLDVQTRTAVWDYIKKLKLDYGMTLFMTTHYLEEADGVCDRIAIIDHGKLVKVGAPAELKAGLGGDIIELGIREDSDDLTPLIMQSKSVKGVKKIGSTYRIKAELGEEAAPDIIEAIRSKGYHVTRISVTKPSMDQVYLEYTGRTLRDAEAERADMFGQRVTLRRARSR